MGATTKSSSKVKKLKNELRKLGSREIKAGVFGEDDSMIVTIARANEYGVTIKPKNGQFLTIPAKIAKDTRARDYSDLRFVPTQHGGLLVKGEGKRMQIYFYLVRSVTIPERSFIRAGFDANVDIMNDKIKRFMNMVLSGRLSATTFLEMVGVEFSGRIQRHLRDLSSPPNAPITTENKGSSNPLIDRGRLVGAIRHKIE